MTGVEAQVASGPARAASPARPRRILMGVPAPGASGGGPALHLPMLVEDLRAGGVEVVTVNFGRWAEAEAPWLKVWHQLLDLVRYRSVVRAAAPDLVHLNSALDRRALLRDVPFVLLTRLLGRPVFIKWHGSDTGLLSTRSLLWRSLAGMLLGAASGIGVLSTEEEAAVRRHPRAPRCWVVRNGLDLRRYERRVDVRPGLGVPAAAPLLLFISRLIPAKGLLDVLRALPGIVRRHGAHLVVVGDGPVRGEAGELARQLGIESAVHFTGTIPEGEAADYYCGCDVLVFPTYHIEGFPMSVFQSVAGGLGIVTTRLRAAADYLREPDHCVFVPARDPAALSEALERLLGHPEMLQRMRHNNRELARRFERRTVAAEFGRLYAELLEERAARRVR